MSPLRDGPAATAPLTAVAPLRPVSPTGCAVGHGPPLARASGAQGCAAAPPEVASSTLAAGAAPVDRARVATVRQALASGSYRLDPARTGDALLASGRMVRISR
ncbi:MAG: flagellar biosynthesis anti-sigma factor FlgM [Sphingomonadales bacterium]|nr:flagellar biosynthesis anti-sigma factor FlgM [Sphingomonadales bacterium]